MKLQIQKNIELPLNKNIQITNYDIYKITGEDKFTFLQGQITNDVELLKKEKSIGTVYCNIKGRIIGVFFLHLIIIDGVEIIILINPGDNGVNILKSLKKYSLFSKVKIEKATDDYDLFLTNSKSRSEAINIKLADKELSFKLAPKNTEHSENTEAPIWQLFFINSKLPIVYQNQNEEFLSHNLELPKLGLINFKKGCYLGQEIIARTEYKAKLKKTCVILTGNLGSDFDNINDYILQNDEGKKIGEIINFQIYNNQMFILASIDKQHIDNKIILNHS